MNLPDTVGETSGPKLSRRDWILLPLVSLATIIAITVIATSVANRLFGRSVDGVEKCLNVTDRAKGAHGIANAACWAKGSEMKPVEYRLNDCGYRMDKPCGPPRPGVYRIVMVGSSVAMGQWIRRESSLAALLPEELSERVGHPVEVYNEGMMAMHPQVIPIRADEIFAAKPSLVLWVLTPNDVNYASIAIQNLNRPLSGNMLQKQLIQIKEAITEPDHTLSAYLSKEWKEHFQQSNVSVMLEHYLYLNDGRYVDSFLSGPDSQSGFLRVNLSEAWKEDLRSVDKDVAALEVDSTSAGVPMAVVLVPDRAQATMISMGHWPEGYDPSKLSIELRTIVESHGGVYVDLLHDFKALPNASSYYFPVDGHPNAAGNALLAQTLAKELTDGRVLTLSSGSRPQWER